MLNTFLRWIPTSYSKVFNITFVEYPSEVSNKGCKYTEQTADWFNVATCIVFPVSGVIPSKVRMISKVWLSTKGNWNLGEIVNFFRILRDMKRHFEIDKYTLKYIHVFNLLKRERHTQKYSNTHSHAQKHTQTHSYTQQDTHTHRKSIFWQTWQ